MSSVSQVTLHSICRVLFPWVVLYSFWWFWYVNGPWFWYVNGPYCIQVLVIDLVLSVLQWSG